MSYYLVLFIVKLLAHLPFGVLYALSDCLYYPVYYIIRYRRRIVRKNLTESFPDKSMDEIIVIEKNFYHFLIDMIFESCKLVSLSPEEFKRRMNFKNIQLLNDLLNEGKSVSVYIGHYSNWEWISTVGIWISEDVACAQIYHKLRNASMDKLMQRLRGRFGNECVSMRKTARYVANAVADDRPHLIGFIADQSPKRREIRHYVPFLNHEVPVLIGTEKIIKHYGYEAMFLNVTRVKRGYYQCEFSLLHDDPKSLPDFELSDIYFRRLEEEINNQPECYLWTHDRFKYARA